MAVSDVQRGRHFVRSLERGLAVIRALGGAPPMAVSEIAERTGMTRAAARRFVLTLEELGYVTVQDGRYSLAPQTLELGYAYLSSLSLPERAEPYLRELVDEVHESSSVSVLDGADVVYVARVAAGRIMTVRIDVGTRFPAYATSMGRVLLAGLAEPERDALLRGVTLERLTPATITSAAKLKAELAKVAAQGYAIVDQELEQGLCSVAVPIRDGSGAVVAAVNLSTHVSRTAASEVPQVLLPPLIRTAQRIERDLR
ncbi:MAG TPA: IclR family transcriptional regulator C-terminal domain-containing protein [Baekduia sp.]|nr:IclR family transcriptional regulator C-terminal domain-containing protein [Baekduia sp.]